MKCNFQTPCSDSQIEPINEWSEHGTVTSHRGHSRIAVAELHAKCLLFSSPFLNCYRAFTANAYTVSQVVIYPVICGECYS